MSKTEQILEAIKTLLITVPGGKVERNVAVPEKIPTGGLIVLRGHREWKKGYAKPSRPKCLFPKRPLADQVGQRRFVRFLFVPEVPGIGRYQPFTVSN